MECGSRAAALWPRSEASAAPRGTAWNRAGTRSDEGVSPVRIEPLLRPCGALGGWAGGIPRASPPGRAMRLNVSPGRTVTAGSLVACASTGRLD